MANVKLDGLDFDEIKNNLKIYLQSQSEFTDYNFEGSTLSTLLDILSYNTHYNSYYLNMVFNEMFMDTAQKRASVISRAKELGYTPYSCRAATAILDIEVLANDNPSHIAIPKGTIFTGYDRTGQPYNFVTTQTYITEKNQNQYLFSGVEVKEGSYYNYSFVATEQNKNKPFELPNADIDLSTLVVTVKATESAELNITYSEAANIEEIKSTSFVYFVQENQYGNFEIYFGNDIIGKQLEPGNVVTIEYLLTNKAVGNGIGTFYINNIQNYSVVITPQSRAFGGADKENTETVRFNSTKHYLARNRAVTTKDYEALILANFPDVETVKAWGGEENDPVRYGSVFVSMKPVASYTYPQSYLESVVKKFLDKKKQVTTEIFFKQPEYIYITVDSLVTIDPQKTSGNIDDFKYSLIQSIKNYFDTEMEKFDKNFYFSKFVNFIDNTSSAIRSNLTSIKLQKRYTPVIGSTETVKVQFRNAIVPETIKTNYFQNINYTNDVYIKDVKTTPSAGVINLYDSSTDIIVAKSIGSVDYDRGIIDFTVRVDNTYLANETIYIDAEPVLEDIETALFNIITYNNATLDSIHGISAGINITVKTK